MNHESCPKCGSYLPSALPRKYFDRVRCSVCGTYVEVTSRVSIVKTSHPTVLGSQPKDGDTCPTCGAPLVDGRCPNEVVCKRCGGDREVWKYPHRVSGTLYHRKPAPAATLVICPDCNGTGKVCKGEDDE